MTLSRRLVLWLASEELALAKSEYVAECARLQSEAYHLGMAVGQAQGVLLGQQQAFTEITRVVGERSPFGEVEFPDIERAKKGMVH